MGNRDRPHDRQAEAGAAAAASWAGTSESLKGLVLEPGDESGSLVRDLEQDEAAFPPGRQPHIAAAVTKRVVDQVAQRLLDPEGVQVEGGPGRCVDGDLATSSLGPLHETLSHPFQHGPQLDRLACDREPALVEARDQEQIFGQLGQPIDLFPGRANGGAQILGRALGAVGQLELGSEDRERCAQLVAGVGDEYAFALQAGLEPIQHQVEGLAQIVDLVLGTRQGEPLAASLHGDLLRPAPHRLDRRQGPPREEVAEPGSHDDRQRRSDQEGAGEPGERLVAVVGGAADHDDERLALRARRTAQDPHVALHAGNRVVDE